MTKSGDEIIMNCKKCYVLGFGVKVRQNGEVFECTHDSSHRFVLSNGMLKGV